MACSLGAVDSPSIGCQQCRGYGELSGSTKFTLGGDIGIAAGPVGRQAGSTDVELESAIYSYSISKGLSRLSLESHHRDR